MTTSVIEQLNEFDCHSLAVECTSILNILTNLVYPRRHYQSNSSSVCGRAYVMQLQNPQHFSSCIHSSTVGFACNMINVLYTSDNCSKLTHAVIFSHECITCRIFSKGHTLTWWLVFLPPFHTLIWRCYEDSQILLVHGICNITGTCYLHGTDVGVAADAYSCSLEAKSHRKLCLH